MQRANDILIRVHGEWNGSRSAEVRLADLQDVHWFQPRHAPRPLLHGYIFCADIVEGDLPHECSVTEKPHRLLVCVLKKHALPTTYADLVQLALECNATRCLRSEPAQQ